MTTRRLERFRSVLVPTDFSPYSVAAVDRALALPLAPDATLELVHALPEVFGKARASVEAAAREALEREVARARAIATGLHITSTLARGDPFVEIIRRERSIDAEVVVIGRHGHRKVRDVFLGTTAARVIRMGETPVLVVRRGATRPYRRPLVAMGLDDSSRRLAELALRIVGARATVRVVHAIQIPFEGFLAPTGAARERVRGPLEAKAAASISDLLAPYRDDARWQTIVGSGDARVVVMNEALRSRVDVIVLGTHGRSGIAHALIGSVAEWVIGNAPCDVLVARPTRFSFELP